MSLSDPIADMLTRIRNAVLVEHPYVEMPSSKIKTAIAKSLNDEGFIGDYEVIDDEHSGHKTLKIGLKYVGKRRRKRPVITGIERVSVPGQRIYAAKDEIPQVLSGMGIAILTTSKGVMTGRQARKLGVGGEVVCKVW
ncbi:MAG: 30S ribosomal protein S8 [Chloroflexota bacterium]|nr:30S ribosomal protein S8 [Chloroflexota bacterium]